MRIILFVLMFAVTTVAMAETNYVNDTLSITLRSGQGDSFRILRMLPAGTPLTILERADSYVRVRTADGLEGWVQTQYLTAQPIARDRLVRAEQRIARLEGENQQLKQDLATLREEKGAVEGERSQASDTVTRLQGELERLQTVAARPMELDQQNQAMRKRLQELESQLKTLDDENATLRSHATRDWFLAGAGVLFGGILLGLILPRMRKKKGWGGEWG